MSTNDNNDSNEPKDPSRPSTSSVYVKSNLNEPSQEDDDTQHDLIENDDESPLNELFERSSKQNSRQIQQGYHSLPPLDEEDDDDHLFNSIGLLTDNCIVRSGQQHNINYDRNESFPSLHTPGTCKQTTQKEQGPSRSWNIKLQAARHSASPSTSLTHPQPIGHGRGQPQQKYRHDFSAIPNNSFIAEENFNFASVEHADTSFPVFKELWQNEHVCDVTIVVGERRFPAHRVILCATIPYFYAMFTNEMVERDAAEVVLQTAENDSTSSTPSNTPTLEPVAFEALLRYAYTGSITINSKNVQSVLIGASFLGLLNVQQACADYLKVRLNVSNVLNVKSFAFALGCDTLVTASKKYIHRHFEEISRNEDFLTLDYEEVVDIINKDELNIHGEEIVFDAVLAWTKKDEEARKQHLATLLSHVRLPLLSPEYLTDTVMVEKLIRNSLPCRDLLDEAKDYHLLPSRRDLMQRFRTRPRFGHHVQGLIYAVGGLTKSGDSMSTVEVYDPQLNRWRMAEAMSMLRSRVGVAVMEGKLYAIGGYNGKERLNTVEVYDSKRKQWNKVTSMSQGRSAVGAAPLDGNLFVCGGYNGTTSLNVVERYSPTLNLWEMVAPMNFHRSAAGAIAFDGYIYALGGHDGLMVFNSVERYDPRTNQWESVEPMLTRRCRLGVAAFGGKIYVCGGYDGCAFLHSAEAYDPNTNKWSYITPMRVTRSRVALVANCGRLFAIGGYDGITNLSSAEAYDIERDCWEFVASMVAHEGGVGVGVIPDN